jgi:membrane protease YdiL (CAAX protease family)
MELDILALTYSDELVVSTNQNTSIWSRMSLVQLSGLMLFIAALWRVLDIFVLGLGNTWINILPSKICPLIIITTIFMKHRRNGINSTLGLSREHIIAYLVLGTILGLAMFLIVDICSSLFYSTFFDSSYPLEFHIVMPELLWYSFTFFFINAIFEETLFRGLIQNAMKTYYSTNKAIMLSAVIFGLWHVSWPIANAFSNSFSVSEATSMISFSFILGVFFGVVYEKFALGKSLTCPIIIHTLANFFNESFKFGPDPSVQGPDLSFTNPILMIITATLFFTVIGVLLIFSTRYTIEDVRFWWKQRVTQWNIILRQLAPMNNEEVS